jgi:hypothetical protein
MPVAVFILNYLHSAGLNRDTPDFIFYKGKLFVYREEVRQPSGRGLQSWKRGKQNSQETSYQNYKNLNMSPEIMISFSFVIIQHT